MVAMGADGMVQVCKSLNSEAGRLILGPRGAACSGLVKASIYPSFFNSADAYLDLPKSSIWIMTNPVDQSS